jgi:hypothetical protein
VTNVGYATLDVIPNLKGFEGHLTKGTRPGLASAGTSGGALFGSAAGKSAGSRFTSIFKNAAKAGLIGLAGAGALAVKFGGDAVSAASDLEESTNKVSEIFGKSADDILKFTKGTADALGQSNTAAREAASTFGTFGSAAGLAEKKNAKFAKRMTRLASDLASFNNTEPDEAVQALGAALRGESEPIRRFGVLLDEATLKAEAARLGLLKPVKDQSKILAYQVRVAEGQQAYNDAVKEFGADSLEALKAEASLGTARSSLQKATEGTIPPLTQQQKLLAAQSEIFKQTEVAQGDFARTSDGLANQQRRLSARFEDAKAKLGKGLLPIMTQAADFLLDKGIPAFEDFSRWFNRKGIPAFKAFADEQGPRVIAVFEGIRDFGKEALPFAEGIVKAFDNMPGWVKKVLVGGAVGGLAVKKLGLGSLVSGGAKAATGGLLAKGSTPANPLYVLDVGAGLGSGKLGKGSGVLAALGKGGLLAAFGFATYESAKIDKKNFLDGLSGAGGGGTRGNPFGGEFKGDGDGVLSFQERFGTSLDENRDKIYANKQAIEEFGQSVRTRIPRTIETKYTLLGVNTANEQARQLLETLLQIRSAHNDNRLDFGPNGSAPTGDPTSPGRRSGRGVTVNIGEVKAHNYKDFTSQLQRRSIGAATDGWG